MLIFKGFSLILIRRKSNQGWYTYDVLENCPIFETPRPPIPLVHLCPTFSHSLKLWRSVSNNQTTLPLLQMITRQLKESIIQGWLLYVIRSFLQVGFPFQYQLINLVWLSFGFFHLADASLPAFSWLHTLSKNITKCLLFISIHIFNIDFAIKLLYLHKLETWKNYGTTTTPCRWMNEIKTKTKPSHITFKLTTRSIARFVPQKCNGIIKRWPPCLTSGSKGRFLVNNISMFGSASMSDHRRNPFFSNKKNKDWTSRTLANLPTPYIQ